MKATQAEVQAFLEADWGTDWYYDDADEDTDASVQTASADAKIDLSLMGSVLWQGDGDPKPHPYLAHETSFESCFKRWKKWSTTDVMTFRVPKDKVDAVIAAVVAAGGTKA